MSLHDTTPETLFEKEMMNIRGLQNVIKNIPEELIKKFYNYAQLLISELQLNNDSRFFSLTIPKSGTRISLNLHSRLVLSLVKHKGKIFYEFMVGDEFANTVKSVLHYPILDPFIAGRQRTGTDDYLIKVTASELEKPELSTLVQHWLACCKSFVNPELGSAFRSYHKSEMFKMAMDSAYRERSIEYLKEHPELGGRDALQDMIEKYKTRIQKTDNKDEQYKWLLISEHKNWPIIESEDLQQDIRNINFGNLVYHLAKATLLLVAEHYAEELKQLFKVLFDESIELNKRIEAFTDGFDKLYRQADGKHASHQDERSISVYLTYHNPDRYTFFKNSYYRKYCRIIGIEHKKAGNKYAHYLELLQEFIQDYILPDTELLNLQKKITGNFSFKDPGHLLLAQDILYTMLDIDESTTDEPTQTTHADIPGKNISASYPRNIILYGPPGTGKTYKTISKAIEIANPSFNLHGTSREDINTEYSRLKESRQIEFVTFHQSMSYEDFVEGIKPLKPIPGQGIQYDIEDGLFKAISKRASSSYEKAQDENQDLLPFEEAFEMLQEEWEEQPDLKFDLKKPGNEYTILGFTNTSIQFRKANGSTNHTLSINTARDLYYGKSYDSTQGLGIYYPALISKLKSYQPEQEETLESKNYVLIIDEINRGNIAAIFGELITLLEEDKRYGRAECVQVRLPYSKDLFTVPDNLFIVGTMNTADRSVEAMDTALRRRFVFEELMPDPAILSPREICKRAWRKYWNEPLESPLWIQVEANLNALLGVEIIHRENYDRWEPTCTEELLATNLAAVRFSGFDPQRMLAAINQRLALLLSPDHTIGHAWLMQVYSLSDLQIAFATKIIPLLREYFYNDYAKIGLVLGSAFVETKEMEPGVFARFDAGIGLANDLSEKLIYELKHPTSLSLNDFIAIYQ